jgi:hypothetical protein
LSKFTHWQTHVCHNRIKLTPQGVENYVQKRKKRGIYTRHT